MKIRRRPHPISPSPASKPRSGSTGTKRLPTRNRMGASMDWPLYNAQGELIDRAAIQAKVVEQTALNRAKKGSSSPAEAPEVSLTDQVLAAAQESLQPPPKPAKSAPTSALAKFKAKYGKAPWYIKAKGSTAGRDSIYLTADSGAAEGEIPTTFEGVQVRITYVKRGRR